MTDRLTITHLGRYKLGELLGSGGMASVYKGYDPTHKREVAIKVLNAADQSPDFVKRFRREVNVLKSLRHPHIVEFYDFGEQDDLMYMVQELLPGPTLADRIRRLGRRRVPDADVPVIIAQLADALDFAHARGIIHRDVKPGNIMYNAARQVVLTDFGIARSPKDAMRTITGPGVVMGTPGYVAPEQAISSATLTSACDIYALGVVLFELATGQLPFQADTAMNVVLKHLYEEPPPLSSLRPDLPPLMDEVVQRALRKEPEQRYASAGELARALQAAWPGAAPSAKSATRPARATADDSAHQTPARTPRTASASPPATAKKERERPATPKSGSKARSSTRAKAGDDNAKPGATKHTPGTSVATSARATPKSKSPAGAESPATPARTDRLLRIGVGFITVFVVGILLLAGWGLLDLTMIGQQWNELVHLIGF